MTSPHLQPLTKGVFHEKIQTSAQSDSSGHADACHRAGVLFVRRRQSVLPMEQKAAYWSGERLKVLTVRNKQVH